MPLVPVQVSCGAAQREPAAKDPVKDAYDIGLQSKDIANELKVNSVDNDFRAQDREQCAV